MKKYTNMHSDNNLEQTLSAKSLLQIDNCDYSWINDCAARVLPPSFNEKIMSKIDEAKEGKEWAKFWANIQAKSLIQE